MTNIKQQQKIISGLEIWVSHYTYEKWIQIKEERAKIVKF